eukprot:SAG31_NODE_40529_length_280_cov_0.845304_1_plen_41_part_01
MHALFFKKGARVLLPGSAMQIVVAALHADAARPWARQALEV